MKSKNMAASVHAKLRNHAREHRIPMDALLRRYVQERLLYRISVSEHAGDFCLKGGMLLAAYNDGDLYRPTEDIDFNGFDGGAGIETLTRVIGDALSLEVPDDGVTFDPESIRIMKDREGVVPGGKVILEAKVFSARVQVRVDVGFGNIVTPGTRMIEFPALLPDSVPRPTIAAYPLETVVAEKLHAMVQFGAFNTRVKDYFDIWQLSRGHAFDGALLAEAVERTFAHQRRMLPDEPPALSEGFAEKSGQAWRTFLKRISFGDAPEFAEVVEANRAFLLPVIAAARGEAAAPADWVPGQGWSAPGMRP